MPKRRPRPEAPAPKAPPDRPGIRPGWWVAGVLLAAFLLYLPSLEYGFVFDDHSLVEKHPAVASLSLAVDQLLSLDMGYRPFRTLSYAVDHAIGGMDPMVFHLSNLLYHLLALLALWWVLRLAGLGPATALVAVGLFAVHPVHIDAVVYISGRRDLLAALFSLLAFGCFLRYRRGGAVWWWVPVVVCFALAFLSKEMGIVVPVLILLYDWARAATDPSAPVGPVRGFFRALRRGIWYYGPMFALAGAMVVYKLWISPATGKLVWWGGTVLTNVLTVAKVISYYFFILVLPVTLRADYSYASFPVAYSAADVVGWGALALVLGVLAVLVQRARRGDFETAFWGLWFFAALLPVAHIVPHHELLAEHYLYLPAAGLSALAALGLQHLLARRRTVAVAAGVAAALLWAGIGITHAPVYRDDLALFSDVLAKAPNCVRANMVMGDHHFTRQDYTTARRHYQRILDLPPQFEREGLRPDQQPELTAVFQRAEGDAINREVGYYLNAYRRQAYISETEGRWEDAARLYRAGARYRALTDMFYQDLGNLYARQGRFAEAESWYRRALAASPRDPMILCNLAAACSEQGRLEEARHYLNTAITIHPNYPQAYYNLALLLGRQDAPVAAVAAELDKALRSGLPEPERTQALSLLERLNAASPPRVQ